MSDETATLKDASVTPEATPEVTESAKTETTTDTTATTSAADAEAVELGRILLDSGYTKAQINEVLQAPGALRALQHMILNNPNELLASVERNNPQAAEKLMETAATKYVERHGTTESKAKGNGQASDVMREVEALRNQVREFQTVQQQRDAAAQMAQTKSRYESRVDDLLGTLPKDLILTKSEKSALRAQVSAELASDQPTVQRVANGNFVDVPRTFQKIIQSWASDRKEAAEAAKSQRERSTKNAFAEFTTGPQMIEVPAGAADSWEGTEDALAAALERGRG